MYEKPKFQKCKTKDLNRGAKNAPVFIWNISRRMGGDKAMETVNNYAQNFFLLWQAGFISNETFEDFWKVWEEINCECANVEHEREMAKTKFDF